MIYEEATLATRKGKSYDGETREEQFARWEEMGRERVTDGLMPLAEQLRQRAQDPGPAAEFSPTDVIERAVAAVAEVRQHYSRSDLFRSVSDALPCHLGIGPDDVWQFLDGLTDAAIERVQQLGLTVDLDALPSEVRLANGDWLQVEVPTSGSPAYAAGAGSYRVLSDVRSVLVVR
ncbi:hypothetical protein ACFFTK_15030 [Pseudonocardia petroleophila]|uniref:Uncharacterized protein n=1 Tax=Pseudonocardia petroleophila TaxID=37331 RepID=A0A7G7MIL1_9PSEU|nr:hypothetical protein [Pseudonocardia petroleophila]QNG52622.1 hypothetical protein H6H00_00575 [Pseudonocardia petroleophila]